MSTTLALTQNLMARASVTPADEGCQEVMIERLAALGFQIERMRFGNVDNFWATHGKTSPLLCFAGHTDVVPAGPFVEWHSDPFAPSIREGVLYGRGAADMKSGLAAMTTASEEFLRQHAQHRGTLAFLITSDEEGPSADGTKRVMESLTARGVRIDWCVVGEPSSEVSIGDTVKIGRRGSLSARLTVHGVQGHVAYPALADNPIHAFAPALAELATRTWDEGTEHFQPTSFQVSNLNAGTGAPNVIPGELKARINLRYSPVQTLAALKQTVADVLIKHRVKHTLEWYLSGEPFFTPPGTLCEAVSAAVAAVTGRPPLCTTGGGTSDGRFIAPRGAQVVELGVVNATIHKVNESVRVSEIEALHRMYVGILERLLA
jgi:succinyl-diaminopimelate desuccinylase